MKRYLNILILAGCVLLLLMVGLTTVGAQNNCVFTTSGARMYLRANCTTDETIFIPNGYTLNGLGHTITAIDPVGGHFVGAVVKNAGAVAHVRNLTVTVSGLANVCDAGNDRLRGIMFEGASGTIIGNVITNVTQASSGCQEGNSIEVRNEPFDGTHPNTQSVVISSNRITNYMKTGIVANGDVNVDVSLNYLTSSANQANLAANGIQLGFGALGKVRYNVVGGNSWCCVDAAATGILIYQASDGVNVSNNTVYNNADVGIHFEANNGVIRRNIVTESGPDGYYDVGIGNYGNNNTVAQNYIRGYTTPYEDLNSSMAMMRAVVPSSSHTTAPFE